MYASLLLIYLLSYRKMGGFAMGKIEETLKILETIFSLTFLSEYCTIANTKKIFFLYVSDILCTFIFNFLKLFKINLMQ